MLKVFSREQQVKEAKPGEPSTQEKAIDILKKEYTKRLTIEGYISALQALEIPAKATTFVRLPIGERRDQWLKVIATTELLPIIDTNNNN
jgi:hypothetical protein